MAEAMGADPLKTWQDLEQQIEQRRAEYEDLTDEEIRLKRVQEENEYWKRKHESEITKKQQEIQDQQVKERVSEIMEKHGIDEATFVQLYDELVS